MSLLVVGSVALDTVETPFGTAEDAIGGSAFYFSTSASHFTDVGLVGVIGEDFPEEPLDFLQSRDIDLKGLERQSGETFRWSGRYGYDLNEPETLDTQLNVFGDFKPDLPEDYRQSDVVFLANIDPELQVEVLDQVDAPDFVALDTMNFWIEGKPEALEKALGRVDMALINEMEARELADEANIVKAAEHIHNLGPDYIAIKRGEYGALLFTPDDIFFAPAYPLESVHDPTGAGDTFAGGLLGYLDNIGDISPKTLRQATVMGCVMASYCVEDFSFNGLRSLKTDQITRRCSQFHQLVRFEPLEPLAN
jgi:sugar/nucleoside kinase (ribokinase family)